MKNISTRDQVALWLATLFGIGYVPLCSGTVSCVVAFLFFILIKNKIYYFIFTAIWCLLAFLSSGRAEEIFKKKDSKKIVIDDFSGMLITFLFIPKNMDFAFLVSGFFLFRMLDMLKIPPADRLEYYKGAKGIVGDDLVAGIYANLILQTVKLLLNIFS
ncbi:MAG: phosphatidylglycerophosphatase A [Candidatus Omnitrophica bacterium]|jgi:phosphatidylglycerophosphatase A|nr:phosphatidylglycerophosphatase A [Candidatus Omnitrophota bacterium]